MSSEDGITVRQNLQITSATKSARSGHRNAKAAITDAGLLSIREIIERYE
jgi:hypothetical protein